MELMTEIDLSLTIELARKAALVKSKELVKEVKLETFNEWKHEEELPPKTGLVTEIYLGIES